MPEIGEIKRAKELGYIGHTQYIWLACELCRKERWVSLWFYNHLKQRRCRNCSPPPRNNHRGNKHPNWKGGRSKHINGYVYIWVAPDDFFASMRNAKGYVLEHRLIVAKALGRNLHLWEIVHHRKGFTKDDNRYPQTLQLVTDDRHKQITIMEKRIRQLEQRVTLLEAENILLKTTEGILD